MYKKIGIVVADTEEFMPLLDYALNSGGEKAEIFSRPAVIFKINNTDIVAVNCGIGKVNASAVTAKLISDGCDAILNYGLSGGIEGFVSGGLSVPTSYLEHDFDLTVLGYKPCEKPNQKYIYETDKALLDILKELFKDAVFGCAVCGDRFISSKKDSDFLKDTFGAVTCDMETGAIAAVCDMAKVPFASLRRVSDGADEEAADSYSEMNNNGGNNPLVDAFLTFLNKIS